MIVSSLFFSQGEKGNRRVLLADFAKLAYFSIRQHDPALRAVLPADCMT